ncbi:MAG: hypothetical protein P4L39_10815 [Humidesulfovibrio sp.]|nr:hypothetical protein [Humidesulfovibrio sp.]
MNRRTFGPTAILFLLLLCGGAALASGLRPQEAPENAQPTAQQNATLPDDAAALAQYQVLREYFEWQATMDDRLPTVFSRRVREEESMAFLAARETVNRRGQLERFREARVDLSGLVFKRVTGDPDLARIQVTGHYTFTVAPVVQTMEEDALFVLLPEMGKWKIYERREGWR